MIRKIFSVLLMACLIILMVVCGKGKPKGNISFDSLEKMQECLNGKWFHISDGAGFFPRYTELVFNNDEIKECNVYGWSFNKENGERELVHNENVEFKDYENAYAPQFKYKIGRIQFGTENSNWNIDVKECAYMVEASEVKEICLLIDGSAFFKATDRTDLSCENFKTFEKFCEKALSKEFSNPFCNMYYSDGDEKLGIKKGIDKDGFFIYEGCDSDEISFEITNHNYRLTHYFARIDEFESLYNEIKDLFLRRTNIIGLIGTEMPDFNKKDWEKNHSFKELDYYLYMNSEGKLVSNIS